MLSYNQYATRDQISRNEVRSQTRPQFIVNFSSIINHSCFRTRVFHPHLFDGKAIQFADVYFHEQDIPIVLTDTLTDNSFPIMPTSHAFVLVSTLLD